MKWWKEVGWDGDLAHPNFVFELYLCYVITQNYFKRIFTFLLAGIIFFSSTGFVNVQHFCRMSGKVMEVKKSCKCSEKEKGNSRSNCLRKSSCCFEKTSYLINAVALFDSKKVKFFIPLVLFYNHSLTLHLFFFVNLKTDFLSADTSPPLITGRLLLLQKSLLLI